MSTPACHLPLLLLLLLLATLGASQKLPRISLSSMPQGTGFKVFAEQPGSKLGWSVALADLNGDGALDIVAGAPEYSVGDLQQAGRVYVVFGQPGEPLPLSVRVGELSGASGVRISGADSGDWAGKSVARAGDVNGDGVDDIVIGAPRAGDTQGDVDSGVPGLSDPGVAYVVYGRRGQWSRDVSLRDVGSGALPGFAVRGQMTGDSLGAAVSGAGDVNGDKIDDVLVGAFAADVDGGYKDTGKAYVVYGSKERAQRVIGAGALASSTLGFSVTGSVAGERLGVSLSSGDFDGDGLVDIAIGASYWYHFRGRSVVLYGRQGWSSTDDGSVATSANVGFVARGPDSGSSYSGVSVARIGDINGDRIDDLAVGSEMASNGGTTADGLVTVVFGSKQRLGSFSVDEMQSSQGFGVTGSVSDYLGSSVAGSGDINGDGVPDFVISGRNSGKPSAYVLFGRSGSSWPASVDIKTADCQVGYSVAGETLENVVGPALATGDINGDQLTDVIMGSACDTAGDLDKGGKVYVILGIGKPTIKKNRMEVTQGQRVVLTRENLDLDTLAPPSELSVRLRSVRHGAFVDSSTGSGVTMFTMADLDRGRKANGAALSSAAAAVGSSPRTRGRNSHPAGNPIDLEQIQVPIEGEPVHVALSQAIGGINLSGELVSIQGRELVAFQRSFPQYYQMHHEDYTEKRFRQNKPPIIFIVTAAWKVNNPVLERWFESRRNFMAEVLHRQEGEELEERVAFHGTKESNIPLICNSGLLRDPHYGVYASRFVEYTLQYAHASVASDGSETPSPLDEGDRAKIIMFKALPGRTLHMESFVGAVRPTAGYDSHSSPQWSEWFFFDETQLCPTHVVEVKAITNKRTEANEGM
eukprot:m51a1_g4292 hypothetical protein (868) ;mRNA; f:405734-409126